MSTTHTSLAHKVHAFLDKRGFFAPRAILDMIEVHTLLSSTNTSQEVPSDLLEKLSLMGLELDLDRGSLRAKLDRHRSITSGKHVENLPLRHEASSTPWPALLEDPEQQMAVLLWREDEVDYLIVLRASLRTIEPLPETLSPPLETWLAFKEVDPFLARHVRELTAEQAGLWGELAAIGALLRQWLPARLDAEQRASLLQGQALPHELAIHAWRREHLDAHPQLPLIEQSVAHLIEDHARHLEAFESFLLEEAPSKEEVYKEVVYIAHRRERLACMTQLLAFCGALHLSQQLLPGDDAMEALLDDLPAGLDFYEDELLDRVAEVDPAAWWSATGLDVDADPMMVMQPVLEEAEDKVAEVIDFQSFLARKGIAQEARDLTAPSSKGEALAPYNPHFAAAKTADEGIAWKELVARSALHPTWCVRLTVPTEPEKHPDNTPCSLAVEGIPNEADSVYVGQIAIELQGKEEYYDDVTLGDLRGGEIAFLSRRGGEELQVERMPLVEDAP